jgi:hypothetical protein
MRILLVLLVSAGLLPAAPRIQAKLAGSTPRERRLIVVVSKQMEGEPRFQVAWGLQTQHIFAKDVGGWKPGDAVEMARILWALRCARWPTFLPALTTCRRCSTCTRRFTARTAGS